MINKLVEVSEHKVVKALVSVLVALVSAAVIGLIGWLWKTTERIVKLEDALKQDKAQWGSIKKNQDQLFELRVTVEVMKRLREIDVVVGDDMSEQEPIDVGDVFEEIEKKHHERRAEDVDEFIQMQRVEK